MKDLPVFWSDIIVKLFSVFSKFAAMSCFSQEVTVCWAFLCFFFLRDLSLTRLTVVGAMRSLLKKRIFQITCGGAKTIRYIHKKIHVELFAELYMCNLLSPV